MWKFLDFPITQILREINFGESRSSKTALFAFCLVGKFQPTKSAQFHNEQNSEPLNVEKWQI